MVTLVNTKYGTMLSMVDNLFSEWLLNEIKKRNINQSELAKLAKVSRGAISHLINGTRQPGSDICEALASALKIPPETVFRAAGLLPPLPPHTEHQEKLNYLYNQLPDDRKEMLIEYAQFLMSQVESEKSRK
jgi:transcriptional regulator with XRE-family HTH domain